MPVPSQIGRYEVLEPIGQGGMGVVYKARDPALDRVVAVKVMGGLIPDALRDEYLARFQREARAAARLSHPHIVAVHDFGVDEATGAPFLVMEHVPGVSLAAALRENPGFPVGQALEILDQVAAALAEAHAHGVVHRDVKPENILLDTRGRARVADFGIARLEGSDLTQTGVGLGTPGYLPPEVLQGTPADARADVFALGALGYHLLTGRKAFAGPTRDATALQVLNHHPDPPHVVRPDVPAAVSSAVMRALEKAPQGRTASASAFREELRAPAGSVTPRLDAASPTVTVSVPAARPATATGRRRWIVLPAVLVALIAATVAWTLRSCPESTADKPVPASPATRATPVATAVPAAAPSRRPATPGPTTAPRERGGQDDDGPDKPGQGRGRGHAKKGKGHQKGGQ